MKTAFFHDERTFWHFGGSYASVAKVGGLVQPMVAGGLPENPETKRRLRNLLDVTGLAAELAIRSAPAATEEDLRRIHPADYLRRFKDMSDAGGGELGLRTPFGAGGYEIAALSAGLVKAAVLSVLEGAHPNAYALSRPPGHHCLPDYPMGFCLMANIPVALEAARAVHPGLRVAVVDWDVHHGNGTEAVYYDRADTLTVSLHQQGNFPTDKGEPEDRGAGPGAGFNVNVPLAPGAGDDAYIYAFDRIVTPKVRAFRPDLMVVACGFDASGIDPLSRTVAGAFTFGAMTERVMALADELCGGRLAMAHEGGYSELHVPFCGHEVIRLMARSAIVAPDPIEARMRAHQPRGRALAFHRAWIDDVAAVHGL